MSGDLYYHRAAAHIDELRRTAEVDRRAGQAGAPRGESFVAAARRRLRLTRAGSRNQRPTRPQDDATPAEA